jgi:cell division protein ZapB
VQGRCLVSILFFRHDLGQPMFEAVRRDGTQRTGQTAVGFRSVDRGAGRRKTAVEMIERGDGRHLPMLPQPAPDSPHRRYREGRIDSVGPAPQDAPMSDTNPTAIEQEMKRLERRLDDLLRAVDLLREENRALRQRQEALNAERSALMQKNEQVRTRVEAMIGRLKSMEQGT